MKRVTGHLKGLTCWVRIVSQTFPYSQWESMERLRAGGRHGGSQVVGSFPCDHAGDRAGEVRMEVGRPGKRLVRGSLMVPRIRGHIVSKGWRKKEGPRK